MPALRLHEFYLADVNALVKEFIERMDTNLTPSESSTQNQSGVQLKLVQDPLYRRLSSTVDWDVAFDLFNTPRYFYFLFN